MSITTLEEFGGLLDDLRVGECAELPYSVYATLFPPGEPDEGARGRAFAIARAHGCTIDNQTDMRRVLFVRTVTNPVPK